MSNLYTEKHQDMIAGMNKILYEDWAPIWFSGLPDDEYASYVPRIISLLASGVSERELADYLARTAQGITGSIYSKERSLPVAKKLMSLQSSVNTITADTEKEF